MERKELEVFSEASNYGIVRMPGRQFPGCVVQGDSLSIMAVRKRLQRSRTVRPSPEGRGVRPACRASRWSSYLATAAAASAQGPK